MKAKAKMLLHISMLVALAGCGPGHGTNMEEITKGETGYITDLADGKEVLIKNTYYTVSENTSIKDSNGDKLKMKDVMIGMKAKVWYAGEMEESLPGRAIARLIIIQIDEESLKEQKVVTSAISNVQKGDSQRFFVRKLTYLAAERVYQLEMMSRSNLDSSFTVTVDEISFNVLYEE
ncbi:DUF3221 domain-containing protein [Peribacillus glennii]|uniref:DUF3221 domain-containing protein n=1 Tax=Peribacillus glennii TaxID=2303991 RepID=A0A372LI20_9BACI|nr:DUF3221 domain-containing protein [Peribacillus glennii]RFU65622.1 hypothetical protein D0466_07020 [Peribacillus glennii]